MCPFLAFVLSPTLPHGSQVILYCPLDLLPTEYSRIGGSLPISPGFHVCLSFQFDGLVRRN
jgi:hypothetical protein